MMRTRFYLLLLLVVASLVVVPEVKAHEAALVGSWTATGSIATARYGQTATLLGNGTVLVAGGVDTIEHALTTAETYDPTSGTWTATGSMATARYGQTATLLKDGRVLIAGGRDSSGRACAKAEIYDPTSGTWSATGSMLVARVSHTATLLKDGRVLVAGGQDNSGSASAKAEIYDPTSGTWSATGNMVMTRMFHTATLLNDGTVLVAGGRDLNGSILTTAEIYNPTHGTWAAIKNMLVARAFHTATLLGNGKVLVIGGGARLAELYDPQAGSWSPAGSMAVSRISHTATLLSDGTILVTGGRDNNGQALTTAEIYNPTKATWSSAGSTTISHWGQTATLLGNGKVLIVGGQDNAGHALTIAEVFGFADVPPTLQLPPSISVNATDTRGATVNYIVTATDTGDDPSQITINCTPASGSVFSTGTTTVNCSAQDPEGSTSTGSFSVQVVAPDTTPPTLQLPAPITADATSPQGATVNYTVTATDLESTASQITINCAPASGSIFPTGTTTVNCSAQDLAGNTATGSFPVVVQDVTAPTLQLPSTITMDATDPQGATVNYAVSVTDPTDTPDQLAVSCTPLSDSVFPIGSTTVNCSVQDLAGNTATGSFQVVVQDVTGPTLHTPVQITANASSPQGAVVDYVVTATDPTNTSDQLTITCTPPSGNVFPIGTTIVFCGAQDPSGNTTTESFPVVVSVKPVDVQIDAF